MGPKDYLNVAAAAFALAAAILWFLSASVSIPSQFPIAVTSVTTMAEQIIGAQVISTGSSEEIDNLARALIQQSRLSAWAATAAGAAALIQAVVAYCFR